jgi:hypothetical protein
MWKKFHRNRYNSNLAFGQRKVSNRALNSTENAIGSPRF